MEKGGKTDKEREEGRLRREEEEGEGLCVREG